MKQKRLMMMSLAAMMTMGALAGCSRAADSAAADAEAENGVSVPATEGLRPADTDGEGRVYMLNFKPETDEAWQRLADRYEDETGVEVDILTAADGQYATSLQSEMAKSEAPTIFTIGNTAAAQQWNDYTYDLRDTELYSHLTNKDLAITYDDKIAGVANCYESYGLIFNRAILSSYGRLPNAVVTGAEEITSLDILEEVADDIERRLDELNAQLEADGYDYEVKGAFASSGLDSGSSWRFSGHLANLPLYYEFKDANLEDLTAGQPEIQGTYLSNFKRVWDMYTRDSDADVKTLNSGALNAESEFGMGEAVFYQNGDWAYSPLTNEENGYLVNADDMGMMPIFFGVEDETEGLCVGTENYWAVNARAPQADIDASLTFLNWVITSEEGRSAMTNEMGLTTPFDTFTGDFETQNVFARDSVRMQEEGRTIIPWVFNATPNVDDWRADFVAALTAYTDGSGDWEGVRSAFVNGWNNQWILAQQAADAA